MNKKGAMELSIGTIIIIVIALAFLILGLILVKQIFFSATNNVDILDQKVQSEIQKLFTEEKRIVVYLSNNIAKPKQGEEWGVAFAIKNLEMGTGSASDFNYVVNVVDSSSCNLRPEQALTYIKLGRAETMSIAPGQTAYRLIRFKIPETAPLCLMRFNINVYKGKSPSPGNEYTSDFFDLEINPK